MLKCAMSGAGELVTTIGTAVPADLPELQRIFRSASLSNSADAPVLLARPEFLHFAGEGVSAGRTRIAVAAVERGKAILGFATVTARGVGEPELEDLFVDPPWQRRGVARRLIEDAVQTVRKSGRQRLWVVGNPHASLSTRLLGSSGANGSPPSSARACAFTWTVSRRDAPKQHPHSPDRTTADRSVTTAGEPDAEPLHLVPRTARPCRCECVHVLGPADHPGQHDWRLTG